MQGCQTIILCDSSKSNTNLCYSMLYNIMLKKVIFTVIFDIQLKKNEIYLSSHNAAR